MSAREKMGICFLRGERGGGFKSDHDLTASCDEGVISLCDQGLDLEDWLTLAALHKEVITLRYSITKKTSSKTVSKNFDAKHTPYLPALCTSR